MGLFSYAATMQASSEQWISFNTLPPCSGAVGNALPTIHFHTVGEQRAVYLLQYLASLLGAMGCRGQWMSFSSPPHHWGAAGNGTPAMQCHTAR